MHVQKNYANRLWNTPGTSAYANSATRERERVHHWWMQRLHQLWFECVQNIQTRTRICKLAHHSRIYRTTHTHVAVDVR